MLLAAQPRLALALHIENLAAPFQSLCWTELYSVDQ
jgi:hypothetical protein